MLHKIVVPTRNTYLLQLPDEMVGKKVEVIAFEVGEADISSLVEREDTKKTYDEAINFFKEHAIDFSKIEKWKREDLYE